MSRRRIKLAPVLVTIPVVCGGLALGAGLMGASSGSRAAVFTQIAPIAVSPGLGRPASVVNGDPTDQSTGPGPAASDGASKTYKLTGEKTISGRVTDAGGRGVAGIPIIARPASPGAGVAPAASQTSADGSYTLAVDSPGVFSVLFAGGQAASASWTSSWYAGAPSELSAQPVPQGAAGVDAVLTPTGVLRGRVGFSFSSQPVAVDVIVFRADEEKSVDQGGTDPLTNQPESFSFTQLPPGDYKLLFVPDPAGQAEAAQLGPFWYGGSDWKSAAAVHVGAGKNTQIEVPIPAPQKGQLFGEVSYDRESNSAAEIALVDATDPKRTVAVDPNPVSPTFAHMPSIFRMDGVPAGDYRLRCLLPDGRAIWYLEGSAEGTTDFGKASIIRMTDPSLAIGKVSFGAASYPAAVAGSVQGADGSPLAGERVYAVRITGTASGS